MTMTVLNANTGKPESLRATNGALLVSDQSPGLVAGKQYRMYVEYPTGATVVRMEFVKPFLLTAQSLWSGDSTVRAVIQTGGTQGGAFTAVPSVFSKNGINGVAPSTLISKGGTHTGGTDREVLRAQAIVAGGGIGNGTELRGSRMLPAGVFYLHIDATAGSGGIYSIEWEDLA